MASRLANALTVIVIVSVAASAAVVAQSDYSISSADSSPVPERSIDFQGDSHTVDSHVSVAPGDELTVDVSAPDEVYRVYLYNGDERIADSQRGTGSDSFTFDLSEYDPGSYAITTHSRETDRHEAIMPVLVEGYDVSADAPGSVGGEESFDVSISVSEAAASDAPNTVSAVFANDGDSHTVEASGGDGEYTATVDANDLDAGEYTVYGTVQGTNQAFDQDELLGIGEGGSVTVEEAEESEGTNGGTGGTGGGGAPGDGTTTPTATDSANETVTESGNGTATETGESTDGTASPTATQTAGATDGDDETATSEETATDDDAAITPGDAGNATATTEAEGPGFSATHLAIALGALLSVALLRRRGRTE